MNPKFVPLTLASDSLAKGGFEPKTVPAPKPPLPSHSTPAEPQPGGAPQFSLTRDGDRITKIRIVCSCGAVHELDCLY
jgi:hypothetical protein